ncbi:MAG: acyltransferase family protein [bacterium]
MPPDRPTFRPDIEGLRGVAILLVVLFHADVPGLEGGFVGVDLFFVLSGFFITGILVREQHDTGTIDLSAFYGKRALRLLPPLLLVLMATMAAVMWLYAPVDRAPILETAQSVAMYSGNIGFARGAVDYFASAENPLLHTWSLAVEEQFYIVWPLLLLFIPFLASRQKADIHEPDVPRTRPLLGAIALTALASFAASLWLTNTAQPWAFFGMPTRIWEFALGGALVVIMKGRTDQRVYLAVSLQVLGLLAIALAVVAYNRDTPYPGIAALLPALGTAALLIGGERAPRSVVSRALAVPPVRWLGRMSYAWYLWHWPLVGLGAVLLPNIGVVGKGVWSVVALVLAWLTYHSLERSARDGRMSRLPEHWRAPTALAVSVVALLVAAGALRLASRQASQPEQRALAAARVDRMDHNCWATKVENAKARCEFGDTTATTTIALLGDSHAEHWLGGLDAAGRSHRWKIDAMVKGGCPVADVPERPAARTSRTYRECTRYREAMMQRIIARHPSAVILSSWDHYVLVQGKAGRWQVGADEWQRGLRRTYVRLVAAGIPVIIIRGTPRTWFDVPGCLSRRAAKLFMAGACEYDRADALSQVAIDAQTTAAKGLPVRFVDMNDQVCPTQRCGVVRKGVVIFTDDNHLTATFSRSVAPVLGERIAAALAK